jgi:DNA mismatch endonuclease (patch repair protein)
MVDIWTKAKRSEVMSRIRGKGNEKTEVRLARLMRAEEIRGWRRHLPIPGRPDFSFRRQKVAVFVDGCFWHGCPRCFRLPKQNRAFWKAKIEGNRKRDRSVNGRLRRLGWKVVRIKECQLKKPERVVGRVAEAIGWRL